MTANTTNWTYVSGPYRLEEYFPIISPAIGWLSAVESRIRDSIMPEEYEGTRKTTEWLTEASALAAIEFFRVGADLLPAEPHIYGTRSGDLVAEFETKLGTLTGVVSKEKTILFGVTKADPFEPQEKIIRKGSNRVRDEIVELTNKLALGHDKEVAGY